MKHTPEPWFIGCDEAMKYTGDIQIVGTTPSGMPFVLASFNHNFIELSTANVARAVTCVNACAGIPDPADLRRQRDELRDAAQNYLTVYANVGKVPGWCGRVEAARHRLFAAIKAAGGDA